MQCINQQDPDERGAQVRLMNKIYHNAADVLVFMGDGRSHRIRRSDLKLSPSAPVVRLWDEETGRTSCERIWELLRRGGVEEVHSTDNAPLLALGFVRLLTQSNDVHGVYASLMELTTIARTHLFECLRQLLVCPWWRRIWVVQELVVSKAAFVHLGTISVDWTQLVRAAEAVDSCRDALSVLEPENSKVLLFFASLTLKIERVRVSWHVNAGNNLLRLLQEFSNREASDDRDKVYGILSLARDSRIIQPDYNLDVLETYHSTTLSLLRNGAGPSCWVGDQKRKNHKNLPSWIQDWSTALDPSDMQRITRSADQGRDALWKFRLVDGEASYWKVVATDARQLLHSLLARPRRVLPWSLRRLMLGYISLLKGRLQVLQHPFIGARHELATTILGSLEWCHRHGVFPDSGPDLLAKWIDILRFQLSPAAQICGPLWWKDAILRRFTQSKIWHEWNIVIKQLNSAIARNRQPAEDCVRQLESLHLHYCNTEGSRDGNDLHTSDDGVARAKKKITDAMEPLMSLIEACERLLDLCAQEPSEECDFDLELFQYGHSCAFHGHGGWMTQLRRVELERALFPHSSNRDMLPARYLCQRGVFDNSLDEKNPKSAILTMQSSMMDIVNSVGPRMFGWSHVESALPTLAQWLFLGDHANVLNVDADLGLCVPHEAVIRLFAENVVGRYGTEAKDLVEMTEWVIGFAAQVRSLHRSYCDNIHWTQIRHASTLLHLDYTECLLPPARYLQDIQLATEGRTFFTTMRGSMGLGPASTRPGDEIRKLPGGTTLFVLHRLPRTDSTRQISFETKIYLYEIIGDCDLVNDDPSTTEAAEGEDSTALTGSLPYEILGVSYLKYKAEGESEGPVLGCRTIDTIMLV